MTVLKGAWQRCCFAHSFIYPFNGVVKVFLSLRSHRNLVLAALESLTGQLCRTVAQPRLCKIHQLNKQTAAPQKTAAPVGACWLQIHAKLQTLRTVDRSVRRKLNQMDNPGFSNALAANVGRLLSRRWHFDLWRRGCAECKNPGICLFFQGQRRKKVLPELCIQKLRELTNEGKTRINR